MSRVFLRGGCSLIAASAMVAAAGVLATPAAAAGKPQATTDAPDAVTATGATLNGTVNPNGASTTYYFEWGTECRVWESNARVLRRQRPDRGRGQRGAFRSHRRDDLPRPARG